MNEFRQQATDYLHIRRALGFKLRGHDRLLEDFIDYLDRAGSTTITAEAAVAWATGLAGVSLVRWSQRLCVVRGFARHLHAVDPCVEVPSVDLLVYSRRRPGSLPVLPSGPRRSGQSSRRSQTCAESS